MDKKPHIKPYLYGMLAGFGAISLSIIFFFFIYRFEGFGDAVSKLTSILMPFIYGAVIAYLLKPVCNTVENFLHRLFPEKMKGLVSALSVAATLLFGLLVIYALFMMIIPQLVTSVTTLYYTARANLNNFIRWVNNLEFVADNEVIMDYVNKAYNAISVDLDSWIKNTLMPSMQNIVSGVGIGVLNVVTVFKNLIIGIIVVFFGYNFIGQYFFTVHADYNVAVVAPHYLPEATQTALQDALAAYGEDRNGDGKVVVKLNLYTMDFGNEDSDAYLDMAGTTKLSTDIQGALSSIFILYDPAGFQQTTGTLRYLDGSLPQSDADSDWWNMVYRWTDCPVLTGLDLGDYASDAVQSESGSSQELMSRYYIGIRGAWNKDSADLLEGGEELWNKLTAGAVSTARAEG